ncbi:MAG: pyridoxal phosphate-dependent aminotransferase [Lachnospiraceae bacterium]|nr:pyridoxal phosphate-dependent aminotransferase [Lachnospiraceae bacterium]
MNYDFDTVTDRRSTWSEKWDIKEGELPMWVADMDFKCAPEIKEAMQERLDNGIFGYSYVPDEWASSYVNWWRDKHGFTMAKEWFIFSTGVIPSISSIVRKLTTPAEKVLITTPVYNIFYNCILNQGRVPVESPLVVKNGQYAFDFEDIEKKLSDPQVSLMLLCNPQNPSGTQWSRDDLKRIGDLCAGYGVTVLSDEIHCDICDAGFEYVPFASVSEVNRNISITCISFTKAFNMAGLQSSAVSVPNPLLRHKVWRALNTDEVAEPNSFAVTAAIAAFTRGSDWLTAMNAYVTENKRILSDMLSLEFPEIRPVMGHATYLYWIDVSAITGDKIADDLQAFIRKETGLYIQKGSVYGPGGENYLRINLACPRTILTDGIERLRTGLNRYKEVNK